MPPSYPSFVSRETLLLLGRYQDLVLKWNCRINLVGRSDVDQLWARHIADCLRLIEILPPRGSVADLGSGAGFPGLVIAIVRHCPVVLIEADQRKAVFLRECCRELGLSATILAKRIEHLTGVTVDIVTARALASVERLCALSAPLLNPAGRCFFIKGARADAELTEAGRRWQMDVIRHRGSETGDGCILEVSNLRRASSPS